MSPIASLEKVHKSFRSGAETIHAVVDVTLGIQPGEVVALMGPSGSGKSTLLNILSGWERADSGVVSWEGRSNIDMRALGWASIGLIPQRLGLLEDLPASENVELPLVLAGVEAPAAAAKAGAVMEALEIAHLADRLPAETSLGEQQRICVARAVVSEPALILADEPTGNQDHKREGLVLSKLRDLAAAGAACLIATHNPHALSYCDRIVSMHDGAVVSDEPTSASPWRRSETIS